MQTVPGVSRRNSYFLKYFSKSPFLVNQKMSKVIARLSGCIKYRRPACLSNQKSVRFGSSHAGGSQAHYGPEYETHEGFSNSLFLATGVGIVGLALYHAYAPTRPENETPLLTRYLSDFFTSDPDQLKKIDAHNMSVVFDAADKAFFKASIERPTIRRMGNAGNFDIASPYGIVPGTETDLSDLRIKSLEDDLKKPESS